MAAEPEEFRNVRGRVDCKRRGRKPELGGVTGIDEKGQDEEGAAAAFVCVGVAQVSPPPHGVPLASESDAKDTATASPRNGSGPAAGLEQPVTQAGGVSCMPGH